MERTIKVQRCGSMSDGAEKLYFLAKQSRILARHEPYREKAVMLRSLAALYERQAAEIDASPGGYASGRRIT